MKQAYGILLLMSFSTAVMSSEQLIPAGWDSLGAASNILDGLVQVTPFQVKGAHDADLALVGDKAYVVAEVSNQRAGESSRWPEIYVALSILNLESLAVGFCDQSHLTRRFRPVMGEIPAAFRRRFQG